MSEAAVKEEVVKTEEPAEEVDMFGDMPAPAAKLEKKAPVVARDIKPPKPILKEAPEPAASEAAPQPDKSNKKRKRDKPEEVWIKERSRSTQKAYYRNLCNKTVWVKPETGRIIDKSEERAVRDEIKAGMKKKKVGFAGLGDTVKQNVDIFETLAKLEKFMSSNKKFNKASNLFIQLLKTNDGMQSNNSKKFLRCS